MPRAIAVLVSLSLAVLVAPASSQAATVLTSQWNGVGAGAHFVHVDPTGCIVTDVFLDAFEAVSWSSDPGGPRQPGGYLEVESFNYCTFQNVEYAVGSTSTIRFTAQRTLASAAARGSVPMLEYRNGTVVRQFVVTIDLVWTGVGDIQQGTFHETNGSEFGTYRLNFTGKHRAATVTGMVTDGTADYAAFEHQDIDLYEADRATVSVSH